MERHYGMDWLRIGAFALLILYHVGMVFVPWGYHVKTAQPVVWAQIPMLATNAWRLSLLFVVSGYASRALFLKSGGTLPFLRNRTNRLLLPLLFGVVVIVPPQSWVELVTQHGYARDFGGFWLHDYFRFGALDGIALPTWNHLWFVLYLWVYTAALCLVLALPWPRGAQRWFDRLFAGQAAVWLPVAYVLIFQVVLYRRGVETHDLFNDKIAHFAYLPAFLFGFGLAGSRAAIATFSRLWPMTLALALLSYAVVATVDGMWVLGRAKAAWTEDVLRVAREVQTWTSIAALIGLAERFANRDHPWRRTLTEAVFPFYIIHQTAIVVAEYWLLPLRLPPLAEFAILVATTVAACWSFYLAGRRIGWVRPLIGLRPLAQPARSARQAPPAPGVP
jgi:glucans biosynthesis protein C